MLFFLRSNRFLIRCYESEKKKYVAVDNLGFTRRSFEAHFKLFKGLVMNSELPEVLTFKVYHGPIYQETDDGTVCLINGFLYHDFLQVVGKLSSLHSTPVPVPNASSSNQDVPPLNDLTPLFQFSGSDYDVLFNKKKKINEWIPEKGSLRIDMKVPLPVASLFVDKSVIVQADPAIKSLRRYSVCYMVQPKVNSPKSCRYGQQKNKFLVSGKDAILLGPRVPIFDEYRYGLRYHKKFWYTSNKCMGVHESSRSRKCYI